MVEIVHYLDLELQQLPRLVVVAELDHKEILVDLELEDLLREVQTTWLELVTHHLQVHHKEILVVMVLTLRLEEDQAVAVVVLVELEEQDQLDLHLDLAELVLQTILQDHQLRMLVVVVELEMFHQIILEHLEDLEAEADHLVLMVQMD